MVSEPFAKCPRCGQEVGYAGRIGLPPTVIYRCAQCGSEHWIPDEHPNGRQVAQDRNKTR